MTVATISSGQSEAMDHCGTVSKAINSPSGKAMEATSEASETYRQIISTTAQTTRASSAQRV